MMGRPDAEAFLDELTPEQFDAWKAYAALEPFGPPADDERNAMGVAVFANAHRDPDRKPTPFTNADFRTCWTYKRPETPEEKARRLKAKLQAMWGGKGKRNGG